MSPIFFEYLGLSCDKALFTSVKVLYYRPLSMKFQQMQNPTKIRKTEYELENISAGSVPINEIVPKNKVYNSVFDFCWSTLFAIRLAG